jgi:hypothetical protein
MAKLRLNRRGALRAAAAGTAAGGVSMAGSAAATTGDDPSRLSGPLRVLRRFKLVDRAKRQRFLMQSTNPPVYLNGNVYERSGPPNGSYFIFNDEHQNERGGFTMSPEIAHLSFDWPTHEAVRLNAISYPGALGAAILEMRQMPDPSIPIEELDPPRDAPRRVLLATSNAGDGAVLALYDSQGRPRIQLQVDDDDVPRIQVLDAEGGVVAQLPPEEGDAPATPPPGLSDLMDPPTSRL